MASGSRWRSKSVYELTRRWLLAYIHMFDGIITEASNPSLSVIVQQRETKKQKFNKALSATYSSQGRFLAMNII